MREAKGMDVDMRGMVAGIDVCDDYCQISSWPLEKNEPNEMEWKEGKRTCLIPTVICKKKGEEEWLIGESAFQEALMNKGILSDHLIRLVSMNGTATLEGHMYSASELLFIYLTKCVEFLNQKMESYKLLHLTFTIKNINRTLVKTLMDFGREIGMNPKNISIISHEESSTWYFLNQKMGNGHCAQFDLTDKGLYYYEMNLSRVGRQTQAETFGQKCEEGFNLGILEQTSGRRMADSIMLSCAKRLLDKKNVSVIYLSGKGLSHCQDWSTNFLEYVCASNRRVFYCKSLFAKGAAYMAMSQIHGVKVTSCPIRCEGMIDNSISIQVFDRGIMKRLVLVQRGTRWYEPIEPVELILGNDNKIEMSVVKNPSYAPQKICFDLSEQIPQRPARTTRVSLQVQFLNKNEMEVVVTDLGFGELFPASNAKLSERIRLDD